MTKGGSTKTVFMTPSWDSGSCTCTGAISVIW